MKLNKGVLTAAFLFVANVVFFMEALKLPRPFEQGEPGPAFYPLILSLVLFVACIAIMISEFKGKKGPGFKFKDAKAMRPLGMICATALFVAAFEPLGYWLSTVVFTFFLALVFEYGRKYTLAKTAGFCAAVAFFITFTGWLFFDLLFDLHLPTGGF